MAQEKTAPRNRVRIFVDFWNYELSMKANEPDFLTDWKKLGPAFTSAAANMLGNGADADYQGMNVYCSYGRSPQDEKFKRWATNVLDTFPGVSVSIVERQKKASGPKCPACYEVVSACPKCGGDMRGTEEKGVDTRIATDMVSLAWADNYNVAVLISSDRDFVPVAEFLQTKGIKVIHGSFPPRGAHLTQKCWGHFSVPEMKQQFKRSNR